MKNTQKSFYFHLVAVVLVLTILACSPSATVVAPKNDAAQATSAPASTGITVPTDTPLPTDTPVPTPKLNAYKVGDTVQMFDRNVTLNSVQVTDGIVTANFTVENISTKVVSLDLSEFEFSAKDSANTNLDTEYDCGQQLSGNLVSGDSVRGNLCWSGASGNTFKFQYSFYDDNFNTIIAVWAVTIK